MAIERSRRRGSPTARRGHRRADGARRAIAAKLTAPDAAAALATTARWADPDRRVLGPTNVDGGAHGGAGVGGHTVQVDRLAASAQPRTPTRARARPPARFDSVGTDPLATRRVGAIRRPTRSRRGQRDNAGSPVYAAVVNANGDERPARVLRAHDRRAAVRFTVTGRRC